MEIGNVKAFGINSKEANEVYLGNELVWSKGGMPLIYMPLNDNIPGVNKGTYKTISLRYSSYTKIEEIKSADEVISKYLHLGRKTDDQIRTMQIDYLNDLKTFLNDSDWIISFDILAPQIGNPNGYDSNILQLDSSIKIRLSSTGNNYRSINAYIFGEQLSSGSFYPEYNIHVSLRREKLYSSNNNFYLRVDNNEYTKRTTQHSTINDSFMFLGNDAMESDFYIRDLKVIEFVK